MKRSFFFCATSKVTSKLLPLKTAITAKYFILDNQVYSVLGGGQQGASCFSVAIKPGY